MTHKTYKHNIFGKSVADNNIEIEARSNETIYGDVSIASGFSGLSASLYLLATPTGTNSPWIRTTETLVSTDNLFYTGMNDNYTGINNKIQWQLDPQYIPGYTGLSITGAQHGQIYGLVFETDKTALVNVVKNNVEIVVRINDGEFAT